jgi:RNA polymerase sigma-70 factor (ECF subfamily)
MALPPQKSVLSEIPPLAARTDEEVVRATLDDRQEFRHIITRYEDKLRRYLARLGLRLKEDQDDVLQETFIKAYRNLNSFDQRLTFSAWLYRIAHNETMTWFRRRRARPEGSMVADSDEVLQLLSSPELSLPEVLDRARAVEDLKKALATLDEKYREVLILRFFEHKEYEEISDILEIPIGSVGTLLHRGKKQLLAVLKDREMRSKG